MILSPVTKSLQFVHLPVEYSKQVFLSIKQLSLSFVSAVPTCLLATDSESEYIY